MSDIDSWVEAQEFQITLDSQGKIIDYMDHINSFKRKSLGGKSPYEVGKIILPEDFFGLLDLNEISADEINLTPSLLR